MKATNPASVVATFVSAILSLILPASAMAQQGLPSQYGLPRNAAPVRDHVNRNLRADTFQNDPILGSSRWGPGNPNLVAPQFHVPLPHQSAAARRTQRIARTTLLDANKVKR
jgi:hypothetical protein